MRNIAKYFEDFTVGERYTTYSRTITEADFVIHAGHSGDFFPHHMDAEWCATQEFGGRIAHGMLVLSVAAGMTAFIKEINTVAFSYGYDRVRFVKPVYIGDTIHLEGEVARLRDNPKRPERGFVDEDCRVLNQHGEVVVAYTHVSAVDRRPA